MTMHKQHPQRCLHSHVCKFNGNNYEDCINTDCSSHRYIYNPQAERDYQNDDCIWMTPEDEEKRIRKRAREGVLDELDTFIMKNRDGSVYLNYGMPFVWFYPLRDKIKELRQSKEEQG